MSLPPLRSAEEAADLLAREHEMRLRQIEARVKSLESIVATLDSEREHRAGKAEKEASRG